MGITTPARTPVRTLAHVTAITTILTLIATTIGLHRELVASLTGLGLEEVVQILDLPTDTKRFLRTEKSDPHAPMETGDMPLAQI